MKKRKFLTTIFLATMFLFPLLATAAETDNSDSFKVYSAWNVSFGLIYRGSIHGLYNDQELEVWRDGRQIGIFKLYDVSKTVSSGGFAPFEGGLVLSPGDTLKAPGNSTADSDMEMQPAFINSQPQPQDNAEASSNLSVPAPEPVPSPVVPEPAPAPQPEFVIDLSDANVAPDISTENRRTANSKALATDTAASSGPDMTVPPVMPAPVSTTEETAGVAVIIPDIEITLEPTPELDLFPAPETSSDSISDSNIPTPDEPEELVLITEEEDIVGDFNTAEKSEMTEVKHMPEQEAASARSPETPVNTPLFGTLPGGAPDEELPPAEEPELVDSEKTKEMSEQQAFKEYAKQNNPFDVSESLNNYGVYLIRNGHYDKALTWLDSAIKKNDKDSSYYRNRAVAQYHLSNLEDAETDAAKALELGDEKAEKLLVIIRKVRTAN